MTQRQKDQGKRDGYRHGDLRNALLEAALDLAREGGPEAVVLREATRRAGVVPNAAYRHYASRNDLLQAVRAAVISRLAQAIEAELAWVPPGLGLADQARASLRAVGTGYLKYAETEPGLFRAAFAIHDDAGWQPIAQKAGRSGLNPFQLLGEALDLYVAAGLLPEQQRPGAEFLAWSSVHGMALLTLEGPLGLLPPTARQSLATRLLDLVERGLSINVGNPDEETSKTNRP